MRSKRDRTEWLACPECGTGSVDVAVHNDEYEASMGFECRKCGERDGYWL